MVTSPDTVVPAPARRLMKEVDYPISAGRLIYIARQKKLADDVINFYKLFPNNMIFKNKEDVEARAEAVGIIRSQEPSPDEDEIRGAED